MLGTAQRQNSNQKITEKTYHVSSLSACILANSKKFKLFYPHQYILLRYISFLFLFDRRTITFPSFEKKKSLLFLENEKKKQPFLKRRNFFLLISDCVELLSYHAHCRRTYLVSLRRET